MSSQKTTNYDLNQWLPADSVLRTDFNADNAKIDAALQALSEQVVQKANQSALDTLITAVNQKADAAAVSNLSQAIAGKADQSQVDELADKAGTQLIKRITLSEAEEHCHINLSDIVWTQWSIVTIRALPVLAADDGFRIYIHMNNRAPQITDYIVSQTVLRLFPFFNGSTRIMGQYFPGNYDGIGLEFEYSYSQLEMVELIPENDLFKAGSMFEVWGTK